MTGRPHHVKRAKAQGGVQGQIDVGERGNAVARLCSFVHLFKCCMCVCVSLLNAHTC